MSPTNESSSRRLFPVAQVVAALVGICLSLYLLAQHTRLKSGIQGGASFCTLGKHADCDLVNSSAFSEILGVPLASLGALYFFAILVLALLAPKRSENFSTAQTWILRLTTVGILADSALLAVQIFSIQSVCLLCLTTYLANIVIFLNVIRRGRQGRPWKEAYRAGLRGEPGAVALFQGHSRGLTALAIVFFVATVALVPYAIRLTSKNYELVNDAISQFFATWPEKKNRVIEYKTGDGAQGSPNAPVRLVVFSDFQCPHCRNAAFTLHAALEPVKDKVFLIFKHYPLDRDCNPGLTYQIHENACELARLGYCAALKGKFWEFHDKVFFKVSESLLSKPIGEITKELGSILKPEEIKVCLSDPSSLDNASQDVKLGNTFEVRGTPTVFINGKHVSIPLSVENIRRLVDLEVSLTKTSS